MKKFLVDSNIKSDENINRSFIVEIKGNENNTWQGKVTRVERKKTEHYRSVLELLKLMESVTSAECDE